MGRDRDAALYNSDAGAGRGFTGDRHVGLVDRKRATAEIDDPTYAKDDGARAVCGESFSNRTGPAGRQRGHDNRPTGIASAGLRPAGRMFPNLPRLSGQRTERNQRHSQRKANKRRAWHNIDHGEEHERPC